MSRRLAVALAVSLFLGLAPGVAAASHWSFTPGAPGIGDPYFPLDGNGGYDVRHYKLDLAYDPDTDVLGGVASLHARATQNLSSFNLDLVGMNVRAVWVDGRSARWSRAGDELTITPRKGLRKHHKFAVAIVYDGVPQTLADGSGFIHTDDGTLVAGQPDVAATWYPVNDHPRDKASYTFRITVPAGLDVVANGEFEGARTKHGRTTWTWDADEPMAPYLTTVDIGEFEFDAYRRDGIRYVDAIDPDLFDPAAPRTGQQMAISQAGNLTYKRLARTFSVPAGGGELSFWVQRDTEQNWDFMFVEAHAAGSDQWTTLPDLNGHTSAATGSGCAFRVSLHPFLEHYMTPQANGTCTPTGSTGTWSGISGASDGYEQWRVDLGAYAGQDVEVSISYASDDIIQANGVLVDDVAGPGGQGSTSFEDDGDTMDGWTVPGAPEGSEPNENDWIAGTAADAPLSTGERARAAFDRQPEIIAFLSGLFGPYPFDDAGGIVDDAPGLGFALETQTRPVYAREWFADPLDPGYSVVVHELAHQWAGDSLAIHGWRDIWLNEGFATYMEWLWSEREGGATPQEFFDFYAGIPADDEFWSVVIGDPGPELVLDIAVYDRGAMTLHALRTEIGDRDFFRLLRTWAQSREGDNVRIVEFMALAERISGEQLDALFTTWLFTGEKPPGIEPPAAAMRMQAAERAAGRPALTARSHVKR